MLYAQSHCFASLSLCTPETLRRLTLPDVFSSPKLRHLTITLPVSFPFHSIMLHSPTPEICCISFDDFTSDPSDQPLHVQSTNNLRELTLKGKALAGRVPIAAFQLASASLTSLTINGLSLSLSIIQALPKTQKPCITTRTSCSEDMISSLGQLIEHRLDCGVMRHVTFSGPICEHDDLVF
ncbi:hypothetical protein F5146DRAFT_144082 [Armillaria mellea]|nr:hypothetical protein F5146DRAFT_144082 [Armillaria mellea]